MIKMRRTNSIIIKEINKKDYQYLWRLKILNKELIMSCTSKTKEIKFQHNKIKFLF